MRTSNSLIDRVKAIYSKLRSETDAEPEYAFHQLVVMENPPITHSCINCDSHHYSLCPIRPLRTYKHSEPNDCSDWQEKRD
jgi:hypothetical protein